MKILKSLPGFTAEVSAPLFVRIYREKNDNTRGHNLHTRITPQLKLASPIKSLLSTISRSSNFSCNGLECSCRGDNDCNDLFSTGLCGDVASCDNGTGRCSCLRV